MAADTIPRRMVTGLFPDRDSAERAYGEVASRGYGQDDVNLVMSDETRRRQFLREGAPETELGSKAAEGAGVGAGIGGAVGATLAAIAAVGTSLVIQGLGLSSPARSRPASRAQAPAASPAGWSVR